MNRRESREQAFALLFERSMNEDSIDHIIDNAGMARDLILSEFAEKLAMGAEAQESLIDAEIEKNICGWKMNRLSKVALALLRLAIYEMMFEDDIPVSVSINEAVDLAKKYGGAEDAPFINGVLGSVAKDLERHDA